MTMYNFLDCTVGQYMVTKPRALHPGVTLRELEHLFATLDFNGFPVIEDARLVGFVTKFDFLKAFAFTTQQLVPHYDELMGTPLREVMSAKVIHVSPGDRLVHALQLMIETRARSFPVLDDGAHLAGIISRQDIMRALNDATTRAKA